MSIREQVTAAFAAQFGLAPGAVPDGVSMDNFPAWDSIQHLILLSGLESSLGVSFEPEEIVSARTLEEVILMTERITG